MVSLMKEFSRPERADGLATVLAIGTATPPNCIDQSTYPDLYFKITNSEHMVELKEKFKRICEKSSIKKRYLYLTEDILKENPSLCEYMASSFDARQEILISEVPKLGQEASEKAIGEWGQPKSSITHLVFCSSSGIDMPGADYQLARLLGLSPTVKRLMIYQQGCFAGGTVLRVAKDIAENNKNSRVLIVCSELTTLLFRGPNEDYIDGLVGMALFADGAASVVLGSDPIPGVETPLFELVSAAQATVPDSHGALTGHVREVGLIFHIHRDIPDLISENIIGYLEDAFRPLGISDWNSVFWVVHPGGKAILDQIEKKLSLEPERLGPTRKVLSEYGNMSTVSVFFILDEIRKSSVGKGLKTTGEGLQWGALIGLGPGITVETIVLRSVSI